MSKDRDLLEQRRMGLALKALRQRAGLTQERAAERAEVTLQAWQNYEGGKRRWTDRLLNLAARGVGARIEDLEAERLRVDLDQVRLPGEREPERRGVLLHLPVDGVVHGGPRLTNTYDQPGEAEIIDFSSFFGPEWRVLRLAGESMIPYAEPGGFVTYSKRRPPRRGQGCVVVTTAGEYLVKRYERMTDTHLVVTELHPVERELSFPLAEIDGVYAIGLRGD